jgi:hypothetical protein
VVQSASITLNATNSTGATYNIQTLSRAWNEAQATWNNATSAVTWATAGAMGATDRGSTVIGTISGSGPLTVTLNSTGIASVQSWIDGATNYGLIISHTTNTDGTDFASSEHATVSSRPKLTITYLPPGGFTTVSYRNGALPTTAYAGMDDATLTQTTPTTNKGSLNTCVADGDESGGDVSCLMRWSPLNIPAGSLIQSASLMLTALNPTGGTYDIHAITRNWKENETTWNNATTAAAWATPGAIGPSDRGSTVLGTVTGSGTLDVPLNAAGVAMIQSWINGAANEGIIISHSSNTDGIDFASGEHTTISSRPMLTITYLPPLIAPGSRWRYVDDGSDQGTAWRTASFDDSTWKSGLAELGYGDSDEMTTIASGPSGNYHITSYFRHNFAAEAVQLIDELKLYLKRDDGAIIYLNGTEIARDNMPASGVTHTTVAGINSEGDSWIEIPVDPSLLVNGTNLLAAEVHQSGPGSSDVSFDFELRVTAFDATQTIATFQPLEYTDELLNPERGWYNWVFIDSSTDFTDMREDGLTLGYAPVNLEDFKNGPISEPFLDDLEEGLNGIRNSGIKVILRFKYQDGSGGDPALLSTITNHITQVTELMEDHADVIAVYQAGWIGHYGEMHDTPSYIDTDDNSGPWPQIMAPFFDAVPDHRAIQFRRPDFKTAFLTSQGVTDLNALTSGEAFGASIKARAGHYNDCFLCSSTDSDTYDTTPSIDHWKDYLGADATYVPAGGETGGGTAGYLRGPDACDDSIDELKKLHYSFMSNGWHHYMTDECTPAMEAVCANPSNVCQCTWDYWGCKEEIAARLGYRFVLTQASFTAAVQPEDNLELTINFYNDGFAAMYNKRRVYIVLEQGATRLYARLDQTGAVTHQDADPRRWMPGEHILSRTLKVPLGTAPGAHTLSLWLPDDAIVLQDDPHYAVQFANAGIWDDTPGYNVLGTVSISGSAPENSGSFDKQFSSTP